VKVTISTELNENSRIPQWLIDAVHAAERSGVRLTIVTGKQPERKPVKS
jgi:hydroxymethylpyrimidine pyrophosphatase-like HAD family hydrolase